MKDMSELGRQLMGTFLEESFEGLERLESGLLQLEGNSDAELMGEIFRAAHSIKGGAATFGMNALVSVAHVMETTLDQVRNGDRQASSADVRMLLDGVDGLRTALEALRAGRPMDDAALSALSARMVPEASVAAPVATAPVRAPSVFRIRFEPEAHMLARGNDPVRILRELGRLGTMAVSADTARVPPLETLVTDECHIAFSIRLEGTMSRADIDDVFAWVADECVLSISEEVARPVEDLPATVAAAAPSARVARPAADVDAGLGSIRVSVDKIDLLMNMVGELVITQSMLGELDAGGPLDASRLARIGEGLSQLARNTRALQESVMRLRSMPIGVLFGRFPRVVHDLATQLKKSCTLQISGETTELDKSVLEKLGDPLVHLVRNSLDHGLENPAERRAAGKPEAGVLRLSAYHRGGDIVVEVSDDGRGLDYGRILARAKERGLVAENQTLTQAEIANLIFAPGFSTASVVSDLSGRGVGMDVVQQNVRALGGDVSLDSTPGQGTRITLRLPLTMAIIDGQLVRVGESAYIVPVLSIIESLQVAPSRLAMLEGRMPVYRWRDGIIPVIDMAGLLNSGPRGASAPSLLVVVEVEGEQVGLVVDELLGQQQVVVKSLEANYGRVAGLAGATILGDGSVSFILDVAGLARMGRAGAARASQVAA